MWSYVIIPRTLFIEYNSCSCHARIINKLQSAILFPSIDYLRVQFEFYCILYKPRSFLPPSLSPSLRPSLSPYRTPSTVCFSRLNVAIISIPATILELPIANTTIKLNWNKLKSTSKQLLKDAHLANQWSTIKSNSVVQIKMHRSSKPGLCIGANHAHYCVYVRIL